MKDKLVLLSILKFVLTYALLASVQYVPHALAQEPELPSLMKEKLLKIEADPDFTRLKEIFSRYPAVNGIGRSRLVNELTIMSQKDADDLASFLSNYIPGSTFDGLCSFRNFFWHILLARMNIKAGSVTIQSTYQNLKPRDKQSGVQHQWYYHIAPAVCVNEVNGFCSKVAVLDPTLSSQSLSVNKWNKDSRGSTWIAKGQILNAGVVMPDMKHVPVDGSEFVPAQLDRTWSERDLKLLEMLMSQVMFNF